MPSSWTAAAPTALLGALALVACTSAPADPKLPDPAQLDVTVTQVDGFSGAAGGLIDPSADPQAYISFHLAAGKYLLRVACTSVDGSEATVTVERGDAAEPVTHRAGCGLGDETGFVAVTTESEPFDVPGGEVAVVATAASSASFNAAFVLVGD